MRAEDEIAGRRGNGAALDHVGLLGGGAACDDAEQHPPQKEETDAVSQPLKESDHFTASTKARCFAWHS